MEGSEDYITIETLFTGDVNNENLKALESFLRSETL